MTKRYRSDGRSGMTLFTTRRHHSSSLGISRAQQPSSDSTCGAPVGFAEAPSATACVVATSLMVLMLARTSPSQISVFCLGCFGSIGHGSISEPQRCSIEMSGSIALRRRLRASLARGQSSGCPKADLRLAATAASNAPGGRAPRPAAGGGCWRVARMTADRIATLLPFPLSQISVVTKCLTASSRYSSRMAQRDWTVLR
mmetsp:Transcript_40996/g.97409  ORF Transcript_40996/g.97409 Transcript_40996/m.97409 type:complete len:200 (+) Transcript_40996:232-831(+)